jgi:septum formation inhibitor-activating ATPase MinD
MAPCRVGIASAPPRTPTSQTRDKDTLTEEGVGRAIAELRTMFDWVICDPVRIDGQLTKGATVGR